MKISELVQLLEEAKEEYGDVEVVTYGYTYNKVQYVELVEHNSDSCCQVEIYLRGSMWAMNLNVE